MGSNLDEPKAQLGEAKVSLIFDHTPSAVKLYRIDPDNANPRETWEQMGKPDLSGADLDKVMSASEVVPEILKVTGTSLDLVVPARAVAIAEVSWDGMPRLHI